MAPVNQLGVLAFASAVLAVPHAHWQPLKRHAHPGAPPSYEGASSADPVWSSAAPVSSAPSYPSGSSAEPVSGSSWSAPAYPSGSSAAAVSGSSWASAPPYPSASGSKSGWGYSTGGYGYGSSAWGTGYSSYAPSGYSTCVETSTLIYRSTTLYSTYTITHTDYESAPASSVAPASEGPGYSAPAGGDPGWGSAPASSPASPTGASCVPDVTVTETVQTTVYVTPGAYSGAAPSYPAGSSAAAVSSAAAPSYGAGSWSAPAAPSSAAAAPSYPAGSASAAAPSYSAPAGGVGGGAAGTLGKRGLAYNDANLANYFSGGKAGGWAYNWLSDSSGLDSSIPYIPMLWGPSSDFTGTWQANAQKGISNGAKYLFSFNEPDMSTQANLSPEAAAAAWKQYMEPFAGQAQLVAPSVTNGPGDTTGVGWLKSFLAACSDCTIDAVAMHWYYAGNPVDTFKEQISEVAALGKGVWLTEFGADGSDEDKSAFLGEVLPWLDGNDSVL